MQQFQTIEKMLPTEYGKIFVKIWQPTATEQIKEIPILLLHDSLGCVQLWRDFPEQLCTATQRVIIAYDRLGFGQSDAITTRLSVDFIQQEADLVTELLDQLEIPKVIALGHSVGGGMAVSFAAQFPSRCVAVMTEAAQSCVEQKTVDGITLAKQMFQDAEHMQRLKKYHGEKAQWVLNAWTETWLSPEFRDWNLDRDLQSLQTNLLIIHGDRDEYGSLEQAQRLAMYGNADVHIIENCGHVPHREQPQRIVKIIQAFVENYA